MARGEAQKGAELRGFWEEAIKRLAQARKDTRNAAIATEVAREVAPVLQDEARDLAADMHDAAELVESLYERATDLWLTLREKQDAASA